MNCRFFNLFSTLLQIKHDNTTPTRIKHKKRVQIATSKAQKTTESHLKYAEAGVVSRGGAETMDPILAFGLGRGRAGAVSRAPVEMPLHI